MNLTPEITYGLRVYQNLSSLLLHTSNPDTSVISSMLHIGHSEGSTRCVSSWKIPRGTGNCHEVVIK